MSSSYDHQESWILCFAHVFRLDTVDNSTVLNGVSSPSEPQDVIMEEDPARPEGIIRFPVHNFSKLEKTTLSDPIYVRNLPW